MKPLLLIDVDGVLNCFGSIWTDEYIAEHFNEVELAYDRYPIHCRKDTRDRLKRLLVHFEPVWATAWEENAHPWWGPRLALGEERWFHVEFEGGWGPLGGTWKLPTIRSLAGEGGLFQGAPLAWIDDDLQGDAYEWSHDRINSGTPTLLVKTNPTDGITEREETRLLAFAGMCKEMARR